MFIGAPILRYAPPRMRRLLLISNPTLHGSGYLDHCEGALREFLSPGIERVLFVPFAFQDHDAYAGKVRERFERMGFAIDSVHEAKSRRTMHALVEKAQALFVGGGNTF